MNQYALLTTEQADTLANNLGSKLSDNYFAVTNSFSEKLFSTQTDSKGEFLTKEIKVWIVIEDDFSSSDVTSIKNTGGTVYNNSTDLNNYINNYYN
jgi:hypothetical protein